MTVENSGVQNSSSENVGASMEQANSTTQENSANPPSEGATQQAATPTPESVSTAEGSAKPGTTPAYQPNFSYKVYDEEKQFPELLRSLVKDKDTEEQIRQILSRADGLDGMKVKNTQLQERFTTFEKEAKPSIEIVGRVRSFMEKKDLHGLTSFLGIPKQALYDYVAQELKFDENPDLRRQVDESRSAQQRQYDLEQSANQERQRAQSIEERLFDMEFNQTLSTPELSAFAQSYDQRVGQPGAFKNRVIEHGALVWHQRKENLSPMDAAMQVYQSLQKVMGPLNAPNTPQQAAGAAPSKPQVPVIPVVGGASNTSPTQKRPKSTDELRKMYAEQI